MKKVFLRFPDFKPKALTLSYDDGTEQDIRFMEILNKYGIKCTFNLNSEKFFDEPQIFEAGKIHRLLTKKAAIELYKNSGHEVAVHTCNHPFPNEIPPLITTKEIYEDRLNLEKMFECEVRGMAYPYGHYNDTTIEIARNCGIAYSRTTHSTNSFNLPTDWLKLHPTCHHNSPMLNELTDKFINKKVTETALLFYVWGHSFEFERNDNWNVIEDFCKKIKNKDDVWYATNIEIYDYIEAFRSLRYSADGSSVYNPTCMPVYIEISKGNRLIVRPGQWVTI